MSVALAMIPCLPPCRVIVNLVTGASGSDVEAGAQAAVAGVDFAEHVDFDAAAG